MRNFGTNKERVSNSLDLSSLENNPRYKGDEPTGTEPTGDEPTGDEPTGDEPTGDEPTGTEPTGDEPTGDEPTGDEPTGEEELEVTDEILFRNLSEKLGREIKSFEDLTQKELPEEVDPQVKVINDWVKKTGRPLEDFFKYQKDYSAVSDLDIAREFLRLEYPDFSAKEIELELEGLAPSDEDLDQEAAKRALELKKYAKKGREALEILKADLGQPSQGNYTADVKQKIEFAEKIQAQIQANSLESKDYSEGITKAATGASGLKLDLGEGLSIEYKITDKDRKSIPALIEQMPHWRTEDGKWNHNAVVQDAIKIQHFDEMIKLAYEQGLNSGKEDLLKKAKNSTLGGAPSGGEEQGTGTKKPVIEGIDKILGGQKLSMKFGRK